MARIGINGLGRMGKLLIRALADAGMAGDIAWMNDKAGTPDQHALLLEFDSVHGRWAPVGHGDGYLTVAGHRIPLHNAASLTELPLAGIDLVIDCTGYFKTTARIAPYFAGGVRKVLVSAPIRESGALNLVYGINHHLYDAARHDLVTAASCTTNCLAPVVKVIHEALTIRHGVITTVHGVTNTQTMVDVPAKDPRRARSALLNLIPTTTGSATAITLIYPELTGRLNGHAIRVPLLNASLTDCVFEVETPTDAEAVNRLFRDAEAGPLTGILGVEGRPLVSSDFLSDPRSSIIDGLSTMVVDGTLVKVFAWYDNEWGYVCRMRDLARMILAAP